MSRHFSDFLYILTRTSYARDFYTILLLKRATKNGTTTIYIYNQTENKKRTNRTMLPLPIHSKLNRPSELLTEHYKQATLWFIHIWLTMTNFATTKYCDQNKHTKTFINRLLLLLQEFLSVTIGCISCLFDVDPWTRHAHKSQRRERVTERVGEGREIQKNILMNKQTENEA